MELNFCRTKLSWIADLCISIFAHALLIMLYLLLNVYTLYICNNNRCSESYVKLNTKPYYDDVINFKMDVIRLAFSQLSFVMQKSRSIWYTLTFYTCTHRYAHA